MSLPEDGGSAYGNRPLRTDVRPPLRPARLLLSLFVSAASVFLAAGILPRFDVGDFGDALLAALLIGALNATLAPLVAAVRLPYTVATSFLLLLLLNAVVLRVVDALTEGAVEVGGFGAGIVAALVITAIATALEVVAGTDDDDAYMIRVIQRIARRSGERIETDVPGIVFLEIDGLAKPVLQRRDARRQRADDGALAGRRAPPLPGMGDRPLVADRREPSRDPAGLERGHPGLPLGREGDAAP